MQNLFRMIISSPTARAYVLAGARHLATLVSGIILGFLVKKGINLSDASGIAQDCGDILIFAISATYSMLDVGKVNSTVQTTKADTVATVASAAASGSVDFAKLAAIASAAAAGDKDANENLQATLTLLKAGKA